MKLRSGLWPMAGAAVALVATFAAAPPGDVAVSRHQVLASAQYAAVQLPATTGTLKISGHLADGSTVTAAGLKWRPGALPAGDRLLSFEVAYYWYSCATAS